MFKLSEVGLKNKIASDPYYRFHSLKEIAIAIELGIKIDANQATVDDWLRLPGLSIHQARSLVELVGMGIQLVCLEDMAAALSLPVQRLLPYKQILTFAYYDRSSPLSPEKINPNTATYREIITLPGMNNQLADVLLENRQKNGKYSNIVDLQRRLDLDRELTSQLMHYLQF